MERKTSTVIRTATLVIALVNQLLLIFDMQLIDIEDSVVESLVNSLATVVVSLWAWWSNNSFSKNAIEADNYLDSLNGKTNLMQGNEKNADDVSHEM